MSDDNYTQDELEEIADHHFGRGIAKCPRCSAQLDVHESATIGRSTTDLIIHCPRCGISGSFTNQQLEEMDLEWSFEEKQKIVDEYWTDDFARCPRDGTRLKVDEIRRLGSSKVPIMVHCKRCGRSFESSNLEEPVDPNSFEGQYEVLNTIGEGGMGEVVRVQRRRDGKEYVAKKIRSSTSGQGSSPTF